MASSLLSDSIPYLPSGIDALMWIVFFVYYRFDVGKVKKRLKKIHEKNSAVEELYKNHFNITDKTILDTREEKNFWKKRALKLEKELEKRIHLKVNSPY